MTRQEDYAETIEFYLRETLDTIASFKHKPPAGRYVGDSEYLIRCMVELYDMRDHVRLHGRLDAKQEDQLSFLHTDLSEAGVKL